MRATENVLCRWKTLLETREDPSKEMTESGQLLFFLFKSVRIFQMLQTQKNIFKKI